MKANTSLRGALGALIALVSLWFCGEASALFTGLDGSADETAAIDSSGTGSSTSDTSTSSGSRDVVNPFDDGVRSTMPEDTPGVAMRRSSSWTARHRNARRFERLLHGEQTPTVEVRPVEEEAEPSGPLKRSRALDYVLGVVVVAGLGAIALLLFRRHDAS